MRSPEARTRILFTVFVALGLQVALVGFSGVSRAQGCLDPTQYLHLEASLVTPGNASGVALTASHAYVADGANGLQIADISNLASPFIVGAVDTPGDAKGIAVAGIHAYVADGASGLHVVDVSDPTMPAILTSVDTPGDARDVVVSGDYAFVADYTAGVQVVDISIPASAAIVHTFASGIVPADLVLSGQHLFAGGFGFEVIDVNDPLALNLLGSIAVPAENIALDGDLIYAVYADAFQVIDVSNPRRPTLETSFDLGFDPFYYGVAVQAPHAFVVTQRGLLTVDITDPMSPSLVGIVYTTAASSAGSSVSLMGNFAFRAGGNLDIIDITAPASQPPLGVAPMPSSRDVALSGDKAYLAAGEDAGLLVVDVSNPAAPTLLGGVDTPGGAGAVAITGSFACVADGGEGLQVINLTNPSSPLIVASVAGSASDVAIAGNHAYALNSSQLWIVDLSNPSSPTVVGSVLRPTSIANHSVNWNSVSVSEPYAYIISGSWLTVVDVSNPAASTIVNTFPQGDTNSNLAMQGTYAYQIDQSHGHFSVTDVSDPLNPTVVSFMLGTFFGASSVAVQGSYAYLPMVEAGGLVVLDVSDPTSPQFAWSAVLPYAGLGVAAAGDFVYVSTGPSNLLEPDEPDFRIYRAQCDAATDVGDEFDRTPRLSLVSAWPNPFRSETTVRYEASRGMALRLQVYDVLGRRVRQVLTHTAHSGLGTVTWDGTDDRGRRVASGIYVVRMSAPGGTATRRVTLLR